MGDTVDEVIASIDDHPNPASLVAALDEVRRIRALLGRMVDAVRLDHAEQDWSSIYNATFMTLRSRTGEYRDDLMTQSRNWLRIVGKDRRQGSA